MVLQLKLASYNKCSLMDLCITVCAVPRRHSSSLYANPFSFRKFRAHSLLSVIFFGLEYQELFWCGAVRSTAAQCGHTFPVCPPPADVLLLEACVHLFLIAFICSYRSFSYCCSLATVLIEIARLATNSASEPPFEKVCVAAAEMLSR